MESALKIRLKNAKLRVTPHRLRVLETLEAASKPLSHLDLLQMLGDISMDRVTLYRVLASLSEGGLVHQVQGSDGIWRFCYHDSESSECPGGHPHFLCEKCGMMICLASTKLPHVEVPDGCQVRHKQMLIVGLCDKCCRTAVEDNCKK